MNESLDTRQLRALVVLARTGSFTETARQLYVTHSAVSHSMRALEDHVGCRLFSKLGKKVTLTEAGEALLLHAERILNEMRQARLNLQDLNKWGARRVRLGVTPVFPAEFLAPVLQKFREEFPQAVIELKTCGAGEALPRLQDRSVDLVLGEKIPSHDTFEFLPLLADRFHFVVNASHPLAAKENLSRRDLDGQPCLLLRGCGYDSEELKAQFAQRDLAPTFAGEIECLDTVKNLIRETPIMGLLPGWVIMSEFKSRSFLSLPSGKRPLEQSWGLIHARNRPLNHAESTLWKLCGKQISILS